MRSVAVVAPKRYQGLGDRLTRAALELAQARGITDIYLLTETAMLLTFANTAHEDPHDASHD